MFNFLKKLFPKETLFSAEEVKVSELNDWLNTKLSQLDFQEELLEFFNLVKDKKWVLGEKIDALERSELNEETQAKVEEKVKSIVLGHKDNYIREIRHFIDNFEVPDSEALPEVLKFNESLNKALDELASRTAKNYQAAQHLFFKPVEAVSQTLGELSSLVKEFDQRLEKKGFKKLQELQEKIILLQEGKKKKEKLEEELRWKEAKLLRSAEGKQKHQAELQRLKESLDYQEFKELKAQEEQLKSSVEENHDKAFQFFSQLSRALRKYEKITLEVKIVREYLDDAPKAFFKDKDLKILGIFEGLEKSLGKGELALDEKERETLLSQLKKAKEGHLKEILGREKELQEKAEEIKAKFRRYTIDRLLEEAEYKLEHFEEQTLLTQREIEELKVKLNLLSEKKWDEELKGLVKEVLRTEIKII